MNAAYKFQLACLIALALINVVPGRVAMAQTAANAVPAMPVAPAAQTPGGGASTDEATVKLDAAGEMDLRSLVEYIAVRVGVRFTYDQSLIQKKVNIIAPDPIPVSSLMNVLQSVLKTEGLVMADAGVPGWMRIVPLERIPEVARTEEGSLENVGSAEAITRVFTIKAADPKILAELVRPTMSKNGASIVTVDNQKILIITDVAENIRRVAQLIELLDSAKPLIDVKFVGVQYVRAEELSEQLKSLLTARAKALGRGKDEATGVEVVIQPRTNQLILIGNSSDIQQAEDILKQLDKQLPTTPGTFRLNYISPEKLDQVLKGVLDGRAMRPPYQSRVEGTSLIIESTREVLVLAEQLVQQLDTREAPADQSPIRFYKVNHVPAAELLQTIQSINSGGAAPTRRGLPERRRTTNDNRVPGPNYPPIYGGNTGNPFVPMPQSPALRNPALNQPGMPIIETNSLLMAQQPAIIAMPAADSQSGFAAELIGDAQVTVDVHTNTIIVVAKPEVQRIYASLIEQLDKRRPQVLVEAKVVVIDTSDDYTLGVEISGGDREGSRRLFAFNSYGFSTVNPVNGALQIVPGVGFNGTLVDPSTADVVVRALSTHRRARVLSSPRILVNDNAEGELTSVLEVPFTSVNASQTVATTSFAGFAEAGTTITVTPTISDENYLQMDYVVTLNSFTGDGSQGVPPPRQTNEVRSRVTVPDGYTVIVGGLTNKNDTQNYRGLPYLEKIPVVRELTGATTKNWRQTSLFVFLRPVILRDDKFKDLKYISDTEMCDASLPGEYPVSESISIP